MHVRDWVSNEYAEQKLGPEELAGIHKTIVHRHVAWLKALTYQLRSYREWENHAKDDMAYRVDNETAFDEKKFEALRDYLSADEFDYVMSKTNRASHLLSL